MVKIVDVTELEQKMKDSQSAVKSAAAEIFGEERACFDRGEVPGILIISGRNRPITEDIVIVKYLRTTPYVEVCSRADFDNAKTLAERCEKIVGSEFELRTNYSSQH